MYRSMPRLEHHLAERCAGSSNALLPGGATLTGMIPDGYPVELSIEAEQGLLTEGPCLPV